MKNISVVISREVPPGTKGSIRIHSGKWWIEEQFYMNIFDDRKGIEMFEEVKKMLRGNNASYNQES